MRASHPWGIHDDVNYKNDCRLVAAADGCGPAWLPAWAFDATGELAKRILQAHPRDAKALSNRPKPVLRLIKDDVPLVGRIVDLQGKPLSGVKIGVTYIAPTESGDLTGWLATATKKDADIGKLLKHVSQAGTPGGSFVDDWLSSQFLALVPTATSNAEGKFRITGIGRERVVGLSIEGPEIASAIDVAARTRPGPTLFVPQRLYPGWGNTYYGSNFEYVARASAAIVGTVRETDTGKPLAGVTIRAYKLADNTAPQYAVGHNIRTTSDAEGRFRLTGMPIGHGNELLALPPLDQPYLMSKKVVDTTANKDKEPLKLDVELKRGVWIRGRVTDAKTGAAVPNCNVDYYTFPNNPYAKSAPGFKGAWEILGPYQTDKDGRYALPGLPGRGIVALQVLGGAETRYPLGAGLEQIPELQKARRNFEKFLPGPLYTSLKNALAEVNPAEGAESVPLDFQLDPGQTLTGTVLDPAGKPLVGGYYSGLSERGGWNRLTSDQFTINCYQPDKPREVRFVHLERKLAGSLNVEGAQSKPLRVQLQPWGTITGRLVDAQGKPLADMVMQQNKLPMSLWQEDPNGRSHYLDLNHVTDREGRFHIEGLAAGITYGPWWIFDPQAHKLMDQVTADLAVEAGQTKDVGDLKTASPFTTHQFRSTWHLTVILDTPNFDLPAIQYAILDKDPVPGFIARSKRMESYYRDRLAQAEGKAAKDLTRRSQMMVQWDLGFQDITADKLYLLTSVGQGSIGSNGSAGWKWITSKIAYVNGKPVCWCIPVEVTKGKQVEVTLTEDNLFKLDSTFDKAMNESGPAK